MKVKYVRVQLTLMVENWEGVADAFRGGFIMLITGAYAFPLSLSASSMDVARGEEDRRFCSGPDFLPTVDACGGVVMTSSRSPLRPSFPELLPGSSDGFVVSIFASKKPTRMDAGELVTISTFG